MNILGVSGLEGAVPFKQAHWPGLEAREYRISQGHDSAAALVIDGKVIAAAEQERFSRKKHAGDFPIDAIQFCLREAGLNIEDVTEIAHGFDYSPFRQLYSLDPDSSKLYEEVFSKEALVRQYIDIFPTFPQNGFSRSIITSRTPPVQHLRQDGNECLVVVNDAMGEVQSLTVFQFRNGELKKVREIPPTIPSVSSIPWLHCTWVSISTPMNTRSWGLLPMATPSDSALF